MAGEAGRTRQRRAGREAPGGRTAGARVSDSGLPEEELLRAAGAALQQDAGLSSFAGGVAGVGNPDVARSLARTLGNRRMGQLVAVARPGPEQNTPEAGQAPGDLQSMVAGQHRDVVRRTPGSGGALTVRVTMTEGDTQYYQVDGATMEEVDGQLPETLGEYRHDSVCNLATRTSEEGETTVTGVTIPVQYYYVMPQWTRLGEQTPEIQQAWRRFYNDLMAHEREHLSVSRREYNTLRDSLRALPADERSESNVMSVFGTGIDAQNEIHDSHAGFTTPSTLVFSDYIPTPPPPAARRSGNCAGRAGGGRVGPGRRIGQR
ncbi:MAG: DUF922 domain-containing protein [Anaerolineae bacterium]